VAYRAEIEIGVKGVRSLEQLRSEINKSATAAESLNNVVGARGGLVQNIQNYVNNLNKVASALQLVTIGTKAETTAIKQYVTAEEQANAVLQRKLKLIDEEKRKREEVRRVRRLTAEGIFETTRFKEPIGPGEASPVTLKSDLRGRLDQILQLEKASVAASDAAFDAAVKHEQTLKNLELKNDDEIFKAKLKQLDTLATKELQQIRKTDAAALADFDKRLENRVARRQRTREAASNAVIGGAFPLLFGQGLGASVGGGIGGFAGGMAGGQLGFGLSLVGTVLGTVFDQAIQSAKNFSASLREGGDAAGYLEQQLGYLDPSVKKQIQNLQASGQTAKAAEVAFNELARQVGVENATAFKQLGDDTFVFTTGFQRLVTTIVAGAARIDDALKSVRGPLQVLLNAVPGVNAVSLTRGAVDFTRGFGQQPGTGTDAQTSAARERTAELTKSNDLLRLQVQLTAVSAKTDLDRYVTLQRQTAQKEYENELTKISLQLKKGEVDLAQNEQLIRAANLNLSIKLGEIERTRTQELTRRAEEARQAAEQAAQKEIQARIQILNLQSQVLSVFVEQTQAQIARETFLKGELGGLEAQLQAQDKIAFAKETALERDRQAALLAADNVEQQNLINAVYARRLNLLQQESALEAAQVERRKNRLQLEKELAVIKRQQDIEDSVSGIRQQQQQVSFDIAGFANPADQLQQEKQLFEQRMRSRQTLLPIEREIANLTKEINSGSLDTAALEARQADLASQQAKLVLMQQELGLLDQLEQRQLRLQQFFERYGQLIQTASGEIANAVTFGVAEMVRGTKTAEQVFADFLNAIGNALISAAQQMIATYIAIGIAKIFAGLGSSGGLGSLGGGGGFGSFSGGTFSAGTTELSGLAGAGALNTVSPFSYSGIKFAEGGYVTGPTNAVVGEGGESEYIIPASKMRSAMSRYAAGARGSAVIPAGDDTSSGGGTATMAPAAIDVRYTVERINSVDYVTADQFRTGMAQAAQQGATQGEQRTLRRLQQSRATRSRLGMN
jgi:hypothetical protein